MFHQLDYQTYYWNYLKYLQYLYIFPKFHLIEESNNLSNLYVIFLQIYYIVQLTIFFCLNAFDTNLPQFEDFQDLLPFAINYFLKFLIILHFHFLFLIFLLILKNIVFLSKLFFVFLKEAIPSITIKHFLIRYDTIYYVYPKLLILLILDIYLLNLIKILIAHLKNLHFYLKVNYYIFQLLYYKPKHSKSFFLIMFVAFLTPRYPLLLIHLYESLQLLSMFEYQVSIQQFFLAKFQVYYQINFYYLILLTIFVF